MTSETLEQIKYKTMTPKTFEQIKYMLYTTMTPETLDQMMKKQRPNKEKTIYIIVRFEKVNGDAFLLTLEMKKVMKCSPKTRRLGKKKSDLYAIDPYVMSKGKVQSKTNKSYQYYGFDLMWHSSLNLPSTFLLSLLDSSGKFLKVYCEDCSEKKIIKIAKEYEMWSNLGKFLVQRCEDRLEEKNIEIIKEYKMFSKKNPDIIFKEGDNTSEFLEKNYGVFRFLSCSHGGLERAFLEYLKDNNNSFESTEKIYTLLLHLHDYQRTVDYEFVK